MVATNSPNTSNAAPPTTTELRAIQDRYATRLKARLARPALDVKDARDGILDCFVASYYGGVAHGLRDVLGLKANPDEVARVTTALFRRRLRDRGASFELPTVDALAAVKEEVDQELHLHELPSELRGVHDQVCTLLLAKASGALPHAGDRSIVEAPRAPAASAVPAALRSVLATWLREIATGAERGAKLDEVRRDLERAQRVIDALAAFD